MDKVYNHQDIEKKVYKKWEENGLFAPEVNSNGKPFSIILPPPNANAPLHFGHAMYVVEDILVRYHRMLGQASLWLPGADHAGFETQFVFEKQLQKEDKSRFDYDRGTLYKMIWDFVEGNRGTMEDQLRRLGFSLDWSRMKFTLDPKIVEVVYKTFKRLHDEGLVYRDLKLINYCTKDGTGFSDLEVVHVEQIDPLYYMKYGPFVLATVRPETKFGDTAVAVHPNDTRYKKYIGHEIEFESLIGKVRLQVVADEAVDPKFGTGVVKVTPGHDFTDFEIGKRHDLEMKQVIGFDGKLTELAGKYKGLKVKEAREVVARDLQEKGLLEKIDEKYTHTVATCYKCGRVLEPLPMEQWFVKVKPLADEGIKAIKSKKIKFVPKRFEKTATDWLTNFHDWNISRQLVWGIRIPAWKCGECKEWIVTQGQTPEKCPNCNSKSLAQDTDTFDTWFSSAQWPFATLQTTKPGDFEKLYPTSVMETGYDILPWWVVRMIMMGIFATGDVPFETVYLHGLVRDSKGQKMSKSKGNVVNPMDMVDKYSADAVRMALIFGAAAGNDLSLSEEKIRGMRNFANKLWNIGRFIEMQKNVFNKNKNESKSPKSEMTKLLKEYLKKIERIPILTFDEEIELAKKIEKGDENAKEKIINSDLRLVVAIARKYKAYGVSLFDLIDAGNKGLERATEKYDYRRGFKFSTYSTWWVRQAIRNAIKLNSTQRKIENKNDQDMLVKISRVGKDTTNYIDKFNLNLAGENLYEFIWHEFADKYIEDVKTRMDEDSYEVLEFSFLTLLKLLHPFMPFITEEIFGKFSGNNLITENWPSFAKASERQATRGGASGRDPDNAQSNES